MSESPGTRLSAADSAWLRMELPENLMTITGVIKLKDPLSFEQFRAVIEERLLVHDRFRQRVEPQSAPVGRPRWVERDFSLDDHVVRGELPAGAGKKELQDFVSRQMSEPLDHSLPLWRFHFFEDFLGGAAMVGRIHHCIGDGIALMKLILGLADPMEEEELTQVGHPRTMGDEGEEGSRSSGRLLKRLRATGSAAASLTRLFTLRSDPPTRFKGELSRRKRAVWSDSIPLDQVKEIGRRLGGTINDVLLTTAAGAMRGYLARDGEVPEKLNLRAVVPVNLRPPGDTVLGNKFGLVFLALPVGLANPLHRLRELKRRMDVLKHSPEAYVVYGLLRIFGRTNAKLQGRIVRLLSKNATGVMTNVPGPRRPLALAGSEIEHFMFWVPQSGRLGLGVSILSYNQQVRVGIATDEALVPDPGALVEEFHHALAELEAVAKAG